MRIFADTSALIALGNPSDGMHARARACWRDLANARFITSDYVLDETLTRWLTSGRGETGLRFVDALLASPRYRVVFVGQEIFERSRQRASGLAEHRLSFTDCTNVVLVESLRLDAIFSFDRGFARVGLEVVPR